MSIYDEVEKIGGTIRIYEDGGLNTTMWNSLFDEDLIVSDGLLFKFRAIKDLLTIGSELQIEGEKFRPQGETRIYYALKVKNYYLVAYDNRAEKGGYAWYVNFYKELE